MMLPKLFLFCSLCIAIQQLAYAQHNLADVTRMQSIPHTYPALKISKVLQIDGVANEIEWKKAPWSTDFIDIIGDKGDTPAYQTRIKMLWDDHYLYIYAQMEEPHIWANITKHDEIIYHNNDFEVFIKPFLHHDTYYEIEVNAYNTILDLIMTKPYRFDGEALIHWDLKGLKSAVHCEGTINNSEDKDHYWAVEMAIPFESIYPFGKGKKPKNGNYWQINFSRVHWDHTIENKVYSRKKKNGKLLEEYNWVWSPIGIINMHYPERWGFVQFVDSTALKVNLPTHYAIQQYAWNIHYLQKLYYDKNKKYTSIIQQLDGYSEILATSIANYQIDILTNPDRDFYKATIKDIKTNQTISLDARGNINY